jgi:hypothetical protein
MSDDEGRDFVVSKRYDDGIFATDPVTLVMRGTDGNVVRETRHGRDLIIWRSESVAPIAFRYDGLIPILPTDIWRVEAGTMTVLDDWSLFGLGILLPYWEHWLGYVVTSGLVNLAIMVLWRAGTLDGRIHSFKLNLVRMATVFFLFVVLYFVLMLSYLSLALLLPVIFGMFMVWFPIRRPLFMRWDLTVAVHEESELLFG